MIRKNWIWVIFGIFGIFLILFLILIFGMIKEEEILLSSKYSIGDEVSLGGVAFNIYKIDDDTNELYLLAQKNIVTTTFGDEKYSEANSKTYENSLVASYINEFAIDLQNMGVEFKSVGIIDMNDLVVLGFKFSTHMFFSSSEDTPEFINYEANYWVDGLCKTENCAWAYHDGILDAQAYDKEYGVRPSVVISGNSVKREN